MECFCLDYGKNGFGGFRKSIPTLEGNLRSKNFRPRRSGGQGQRPKTVKGEFGTE